MAEEEGGSNSAYLEAMFLGMLREWGLESLAGWAAQMAQEEVSAAEFIQRLEGRPEYRQQFAPIFERREKGLPPITPQYVMQYRNQMLGLEQQFDLPVGTLDADRYLVNDVSFNEAQSRLGTYQALMYEEDQAVMDELRSAGVTDGAILGWVINPDQGLPAIQEQVRTAQISADARAEDIDLSWVEAQALENQGISRDVVREQAGRLSTAGDIRSGVGGEIAAMTREEEMAWLSGSQAASQRMASRLRRVQRRFEEGGGFQRSRATGGATGLGSA